MVTRRTFMRSMGGATVAGALASFNEGGIERILAASAVMTDMDPDKVAADENFWREIQQAFTVDRSMINLNNGGVCPSPRVVQEAQRRYLEYSNEAPVHTMWRVLEP
ncbi:MAG: aminotransferase, partial [Blastocatellia bacterium]|nr:aminotransferase [Blastocatellia bacterium]